MKIKTLVLTIILTVIALFAYGQTAEVVRIVVDTGQILPAGAIPYIGTQAMASVWQKDGVPVSTGRTFNVTSNLNLTDVGGVPTLSGAPSTPGGSTGLGTQQVTRVIEGSYWNNQHVPLWQGHYDQTATLVAVDFAIMGVYGTPAAATLVCNLEVCPWGNMQSAGTRMMTNNVAVGTGGVQVTAFSNAIINPRAHVVFTTPTTLAETGDVRTVSMTLYYRL